MNAVGALMNTEAAVQAIKSRYPVERWGLFGNKCGPATGEARQMALDFDLKTYHGGPCGKCGGTERYTQSAGCVSCRRARSKKQGEQRKAKNAQNAN